MLCGTMEAHTLNSAEGVLPYWNWTMSLTKVEGRRAADLRKPPRERRGACRSQVPMQRYWLSFRPTRQQR